ncbi:MAG: RNA polymerase sigma factor [candidate division KSB1 bacterium]|nr:RNA polymerase sigma factor [candidate division KSB1 bacterium]MDZ7336063.1 RNA polymerase sigma factor [candidate division KSB1 bacterium]MDZ7358049.1 RNA polymerase sigma factor [candidate division KSB1 bacterium]MDZ7402248.1 RNA polymerase sigma factor [candidate division KSB1 bacterium]
MSRNNQINETEIDRERLLVERAKQNSADFEHLFNKFFDKIFNYALRRTGDPYLADDITSATFMKALEQIENFNWRGISISAWLYRIATNEINQLYRKSKKTIALNDEVKRSLADDRLTDTGLLELEEMIAKNERFRRVHAALSRLKPKYQAALTLRYFENKSIKEIAAILDLSENTVKTHIHRGLSKLKDWL